MRRASASVDRAAATSAAPAAAAATPPASSAPPAPTRPTPPLASAQIARDTTLDDAVTRLAQDLRAIPGIERFGAVRLGELDRTGPRPLRTMWRVARSQLDDRYGNLTIGEMLDRYGKGGGGTSASA
jgi:hypothetical protein